MIHLRTLGALELRKPNGAELRSVLAQPKRVALLAYLAVASPQGFHRRDTLLALLWPDLDDEHARSALSQAIYYLRRSLGREVVLSRGNEEVALDPDRLWCDAAAFRQALATGAVPEALEIYRGDLLPGFFLSDALAWERWLEEERARLRSRAAEAAWALAESSGAEGSTVNAAQWGRRALALAPGDEGQFRRLLTLLDRVGDRAGALHAYEAFAERLARDYELEPSPETLALIAEVRARTEPTKQNASHVRYEPLDTAEPSLELASSGHPDLAASADEQRATRGGADHAPSHRLRQKRRLLFGGIAALIVALLAVPFLWPRMYATDAAPEPRADAGSLAGSRLAVLPLANYSPDPADGYFADGMTEELISRLSRLHALRVIARTSVTPYKGNDKGIAEIGRELNVGTVLEGSVRKIGDQVRIAVQLIDPESQEHLWSEVYDAELADVLAVQREIAERVAEALQLEMRAREQHQLADRGTEHADAYTEYLKGRYFLGKLDAVSFRNARDHFQQALDLDPAFAQAWSGLADAYEHLSSVSALHADQAYPRARAAAERALELDPALADAHASLAMALSMYYRNSEAAERHFRRAIELDPSYARARRMYASHLRNLGRFDEALAEVRQAQELDPLSAFPRLEEGIILYVARRHDAAIAQSRRLLDTAPGSAHPYLLLALAYAQREQYEEALAALRQADPRGNQPDAHGIRGYIYAQTGRRNDALQMLDTLDQLALEQPVSAFHRAPIHVGLGEHDRAIDVLEQAADERIGLIRLLKVEPIFDPVRSQPRFQALLEKVGLEVQMER
jgi:TolB-like protein/DNA-binding SARP family transcriptional activator/Flp pilus assembly protein TadD